jgi:predicted transcriptional regulator
LVEDHVSDTLKVLSDIKSFILYETIAAFHSGLRSNDLNRNLQLTPKQLYSRIPLLVKAGLVKKLCGKYSLTSYGRVIQISLDIMNKASFNYHKLLAIDTIEASSISNAMPEEERKKIVQVLIHNRQIKDILSNENILKSNIKDNESKVQSIPSVVSSD